MVDWTHRDVDFTKDVRIMSDREWRDVQRALGTAEYAAYVRDRFKSDAVSEPEAKTGLETGTTSSTARAPDAHGGSPSNALEWSDSQWQAALRSLK
jgi:hypothetical protein